MTSSRLFPHILANTAIAGFTNILLWFAITFWAYLEIKSIFVTGMIGEMHRYYYYHNNISDEKL